MENDGEYMGTEYMVKGGSKLNLEDLGIKFKTKPLASQNNKGLGIPENDGNIPRYPII